VVDRPAPIRPASIRYECPVFIYTESVHEKRKNQDERTAKSLEQQGSELTRVEGTGLRILYAETVDHLVSPGPRPRPAKIDIRATVPFDMAMASWRRRTSPTGSIPEFRAMALSCLISPRSAAVPRATSRRRPSPPRARSGRRPEGSCCGIRSSRFREGPGITLSLVRSPRDARRPVLVWLWMLETGRISDHSGRSSSPTFTV